MEKIKDFLSKLGLFKLVKYFLKRPYYTYSSIVMPFFARSSQYTAAKSSGVNLGGAVEGVLAGDVHQGQVVPRSRAGEVGGPGGVGPPALAPPVGSLGAVDIRPGRGVDDDVVGEPSCDGGGHRLAGVVKDGKVRWRALNTSEPCGLRRPVGCDGLWITLFGPWLGGISDLPRVRTACSRISQIM